MRRSRDLGFYFDLGGVLIPDPLGQNARAIFRQLAERHGVDPEHAYNAYTQLQPQLDLGTVSVTDLCRALGFDQLVFDREWLALHPSDPHLLDRIHSPATPNSLHGLVHALPRRPPDSGVP